MTTPTVKPGTAEAVTIELERAIHEHRIPPGTKLGEDELGEIYGVSRTIVRSALQTLSHQQLVELRRNKGAFVAQPSVREAREVFEARALVEPRVAHAAAERATPEDIKLLRQHIKEEHAAMDEGNPGRALFLSGSFHNEIARIADQTTLQVFIAQLVSRSSLIIALYWQRRSALCESHAHDALVEAIANHEGARAEELMQSHLVDLLTALDLRNAPAVPGSLKEALE